MDKIQRRFTQKTTKESHKSIIFGTHVPWVILKHPRTGAQNNLKQEVLFTNLKWPTTVPTIRMTQETPNSMLFGDYFGVFLVNCRHRSRPF